MKKPAIFIDAFIGDTEKKKWFDYNVNNFIKEGFDVFIISNKMTNFDKFEDVKYFEYDCENRLLTDRSKYKFHTKFRMNSNLYPAGLPPQLFTGLSEIHGFTNWSILYNLKKISGVLKRFGYDHAIRCEYDVVFKSYNLMDTIFKDFGSTENSKKCMIMPCNIGVTTNVFLFDTNYIDSIIPTMETEDDYIKFLNNLYGYNLSPVFEGIFRDLIKDQVHYLDVEKSHEHIENIDMCLSDGDLGLRHKIGYGKLQITPVNDNKQFFISNLSQTREIYLEYITEGYRDIFRLSPSSWLILDNCKNFVEIKSSEFKNNEVIKFDLSQPCDFTIKPIS